MARYEVVDCPFNRHWYPEFIGKIYDNPPPYALLRVLGAEEVIEASESALKGIAGQSVKEA